MCGMYKCSIADRCLRANKMIPISSSITSCYIEPCKKPRKLVNCVLYIKPFIVCYIQLGLPMAFQCQWINNLCCLLFACAMITKHYGVSAIFHFISIIRYTVHYWYIAVIFLRITHEQCDGVGECQSDRCLVIVIAVLWALSYHI